MRKKWIKKVIFCEEFWKKFKFNKIIALIICKMKSIFYQCQSQRVWRCVLVVKVIAFHSEFHDSIRIMQLVKLLAFFLWLISLRTTDTDTISQNFNAKNVLHTFVTLLKRIVKLSSAMWCDDKRKKSIE